jgi:hypothetical protein
MREEALFVNCESVAKTIAKNVDERPSCFAGHAPEHKGIGETPMANTGPPDMGAYSHAEALGGVSAAWL